MRKRIASIKLVREVDTDADVSWIGKYSDKKESTLSIDRQERGDMLHNELRYFTSTNATNKKEAEQDYKRMESINSGSIWFYSIKAIAGIQTREGVSSWLYNKISSGGLWGLESDGEESDFREVEDGQLDDLKEVLLTLGFSNRQIGKVKVERDC